MKKIVSCFLLLALMLNLNNISGETFCNDVEVSDNYAGYYVKEGEYQDISASDDDWKNVYAKLIEDEEESLVNQYSSLGYYDPEFYGVSGYLYDMNKDGIPELFYEVYADILVDRKQYTFIDGELKEINYYPSQYVRNERCVYNCIVTDSYLGQDIGCDVELDVLRMEGNEFFYENYLFTNNFYESSSNTEPQIIVTRRGKTFQVDYDEIKSALEDVGIIVERNITDHSEYTGDYTEVTYKFEYNIDTFQGPCWYAYPQWHAIDDLVTYIYNYNQDAGENGNFEIYLKADDSDYGFNNVNTYNTGNSDEIDNNESVLTEISYLDGSTTVTLSKEMFERDNSQCYKDIALLSVVLSKAAYDGWTGDKDGRYIVGAYKSLGFDDENISLYSYPDSEYNNSKYIFSDNTYAFSIANRKLGEKTLLVIDFRGTKSLGDIYKDIKIWSSHILDYKISGNYVWGGFYDFFVDYNIAIEEYYNNHPEVQSADNDGTLVILVTGHSLGAAAANMTGRQLNEGTSVFNNLKKENIYVYTFACPLIENNAIEYNNIFNIINRNDLIPFSPVPFKLKRNGHDILFKTKKITGNHECNTYIDAVKSEMFIPEISIGANEVYRFGAALCPVDIEIVRDDVVVGKVVDNEIVICDESILLEVEDDHKFFVLPDDDAYTVKINATDDGQMSFYLVSSDSDYMMSYSDVDIKSGDNFVAEIPANDELDKTKLNYKNGKKTITIPEDSENETSGEQFKEIRNKKDKSFIAFIIIGLAVALIINLTIITVLLIKNRKEKNKKKNSLKNNLNSNNIEKQKDSESDIIMSEQKQKETENKSFCTTCGKELSNKQRFCPVCGTKNRMYKE